ncbi:MAG TPA: hypothetical protein VEU11_06135 [Terriglobales bacterium]|nr:hypothetical protein [Terriglobales bacterium]
MVSAAQWGISPTTWRITLNFSSLSDENGNLIPTNSVRKLRWTYSADLQPGTYQRSEFQVTVANWTVTGSNLSYQVAGPASRRVEDTAPEVAYTGVWDRLPGTNVPVISTGNFSGGTIHSTSTPGDSLACTYTASQAHQLYLGTRKASNGTQITVVLDGNAPISLDLSLAGEDVLVRVPLGTLAGQRPHTVRITHAGTSSTYFYFDFLELAIPTATLPVFAANPKITLATDWDTDHSIALAPKRTAWMIQSLGFTGRANHYAGALWHYELVAQGFTYASATVTFSGTPDPSVPGAFTSISIGFQGSTSPPTVFQHLTLFGDTAASIAKAFELLINNGSTAIWAAASGNTLAITARAIGVAGGQITVAASSAMAGFTLTVSGTPLADGSYPLAGGQDGNWRTDLTAVPRMNRAARDWNRSFFRALAGYGITATAAFSMELQHGDPSPAAGIAQRYPSGNAVMLNTPALQTNFSPASTAFWQQAYLDLATLVVDAGQTPYLQFGEVQWWYFPDDKSGMPYYDAYTTTTFQATYGRTMTVFTGSNVDPSQYPQEVSFLSGLIAKFTSSIMSFVRQTYPNAKFEVLYPPDTNNSPLDTAVNLAPNWTPATLDCLKTENFTFTGNRNLDQAKSSILLPMQLGFPQSKSSHLVGITGYSTPWAKEARMALGQNLDSVVLFALDQFCLMACPVPPPKSARRALYMG